MNFHTFLPFIAIASLPLFGAAETDAPAIQLDPLDVTANRPAPLTVPALDAAREELGFTPGGIGSDHDDRHDRSVEGKRC